MRWKSTGTVSLDIVDFDDIEFPFSAVAEMRGAGLQKGRRGERNDHDAA
jgi:hypothetical protein